ncbi:hypothetical protein GF420_09990 [candidate division GN15 bacterium]|nr:hypothetical protein [candidate division GN15 bacterium]
MRYELRSISLWTTLKVGFFLNLVTGFGLGLFYAVFSTFTISLTRELMPFGGMAGGQLMSADELLVFLPLLFAFGNAVFGTLFLWLVALVYNLLARLMGGLEFALKPDEESAPVARPQPAQSDPPPSTPAVAPSASPVAPAQQAPPSSESDSNDRPPPPPPVLGRRREPETTSQPTAPMPSETPEPDGSLDDEQLAPPESFGGPISKREPDPDEDGLDYERYFDDDEVDDEKSDNDDDDTRPDIRKPEQ